MSPDKVAVPEQNITFKRLQSLYELCGRMNSIYDHQELLTFVLETALRLAGGNQGLLLLSDDYIENLEKVAVVRGNTLDEPRLGQILDFVNTPGITDILNRGKPDFIADSSVDGQWQGMALPLKIEQQLIGLVYVDHLSTTTPETNDLDFLSAFADQAALAINRAQEHRRQVEELTLLNRLSRSVVQALDLNEVLTRIVADVTRMLNVEASSVLLLDELTAELTFATSVSNGKPVQIPTRLKIDQGIAGWVVVHGEYACVNDVTQDPRWFGEVETGFVTHSLLCVPLQSDGRVVGVLEALNKQGTRSFDPRDIARLSAFAVSATIAIENARLFQEATQAGQLHALNEVAMTLSSTLDLNKILDEGLEQLLIVLKAEAGIINLVNDQTQTNLFNVQSSRRHSADAAQIEQRTDALGGLTAWMLNRNIEGFFKDGVFIIDGAHSEQTLEHEVLSASGIKALAIAPVKLSHTVTGRIAIITTRPHIYSLEEISLLSSIARIIGLAAQNALHYLQSQGQTLHLTYLNEIGSVLTSSLDLDHVLKVIIEAVNSLLQTELTSIFLIDEETNELVLRYSTRGDANIRLPAPWQGIAGWVATNDQPALVNDTESDPRHLRQIALETGYETRSLLCVPLKVEGQVIGVVEVLNKTDGHQFTYHHQMMLVELTQWAAIALHNARLFDERVRAYERLNTEQQRRIAAETRGAMAAIILDMAHTMNNVIGAIRVWAANLERIANTAPQEPLSSFEKPIGQIRQNAEEAIKLMGSMTGPLVKAEMTPTDVHACLDDAIQNCWWPDNIHLTKAYGEGIPLVKANDERLEAAFTNLLSNAIRAMTPNGGEITVSTRNSGNDKVEIIIVDNGPGIPPELQERVFDPGISGREGGLGIGLWLVETFIDQFGGHIDFVTSETAGTTFRITLQPMELQD